MTIKCRCGAVGEIPPRDIGYRPPGARRPVIGWRGGNVDARWVAIEELSPTSRFCPGCQHRACIYVVPANGAARPQASRRP